MNIAIPTELIAIAAYIGPGAGLLALGPLLVLLGIGLLVIAGLVWYPIKLMLRKWKTTAHRNSK